jgi:hypothetical protein
MPTDLKGQRWTVRIAEVHRRAIGDVDLRHPPAIDVHPVERTVVDRLPPVVLEPQHDMRSGHQRMGQADIGAQIPADDHIVSGRERARRPVVSDGEDGRGGLVHRRQLYRSLVTTHRVRV